ncbi:AMP-binding protein [Nocardioides piscis]|uniref:Acetate--CoA ligase n=1 Tax=Nocardioides piscis TaxID=2714938 RepID=A0A6G7YH86_9ACTN|nr:AMP-binding protein [Nocardioides piscis]QIK75998.1 acetate--CoA ligase [Nocardioides piscis]
MPEPDPTMDSYLARWSDIAEALVWDTPFTELFRSRPPLHDWFVGGSLNLSVNCIDRHLDDHGDREAILWEGEPGERRVLTYRELHAQVERLAAGLRELGVGPGGRVALHLGWVPETVVAMMACARTGAEYTVIPVALPVEALAIRVDDFRPQVILTQDGGWRHGAILPLKARLDEALEASSGVEHTVVVRRTGIQVDWYEGDRWYDDLVGNADPSGGAPVSVAAAHPVACVHLANRRGHPVAIRLGTANLAVVALANHLHSLGDGDVFWGAADIAWLGAQAHGVVGPLLAGARTVMYEGTLDIPDPARTWQIIERYDVTAMLTSPSIVRALRSWSLTPTGSTGSLRRLTTIGDRLDPDLRAWLGEVLGDEVALADAWGQLELGGVVTSDRPVDDRMPAAGFIILGTDGSPVAPGEAGEWAMLRPWPGLLRDVEAPEGTDPTSYHWERHPGFYATGDLARLTPTGQIEFLGRVDEVITVSGQLVSLNEVRDVLLDQPFVADADSFETTDQRLGRVVGAAVVLAPGTSWTAAMLRDLQDAARELLGGLSRPYRLLVLDRLGGDLDPVARRQALAVLAHAHEHRSVTWDQVVQAARDLPVS